MVAAMSGFRGDAEGMKNSPKPTPWVPDEEFPDEYWRRRGTWFEGSFDGRHTAYMAWTRAFLRAGMAVRREPWPGWGV